MPMAVLIIVLGIHNPFPSKIEIKVESIDICHALMDNLYVSWYRKIDRKLTLPTITVKCEELG